ncbi:alpha-galactosidase [Paenibacillus harenae]|nr:alpha-galactosidase [Paenibacillus harenae]
MGYEPRADGDWIRCRLAGSSTGDSEPVCAGLYDLLERLTSAFPQILFESCSSGGGRFDPGMLYDMRRPGQAIIRTPWNG